MELHGLGAALLAAKIIRDTALVTVHQVAIASFAEDRFEQRRAQAGDSSREWAEAVRRLLAEARELDDGGDRFSERIAPIHCALLLRLSSD